MSNDKIRYLPYANFYLNCIDCEKNDAHFLVWYGDGSDDIEHLKKLLYISSIANRKTK